MNNNTLRIGTRKSRLAMVQTEIVREVILAHFPFLEIEIVPMSTKGDKILDRSLTSFGGKGVFTKELEDALLKGAEGKSHGSMRFHHRSSDRLHWSELPFSLQSPENHRLR